MNEIMTLLARVSAATKANKKAKASLQREFAPDFNPVALLAPGETRLSEVFRWMLDETESHGQGCAFRDLFVADLLGGQPTDWDRASVACEVVTADGFGRIDVLMISRDGTRRLAIENKPWAGWQEAQLSRYLQDQSLYDCAVHVLALIGSKNSEDVLREHWDAHDENPCPDNVSACDFDAVADWLDKSAGIARPTRVREFLFSIADYCRRYVMNEPTEIEIEETAALMCDGGPDILNAAINISAALPSALTQHIAKLVGGTAAKVNAMDVVRLEVAGVPLSFVLFGTNRPWAGVTEQHYVGRLSDKIDWGAPETKWPGWNFLKKLGNEGDTLANALANHDLDRVVELMPAVSQNMLDLEKA